MIKNYLHYQQMNQKKMFWKNFLKKILFNINKRILALNKNKINNFGSIKKINQNKKKNNIQNLHKNDLWKKICLEMMNMSPQKTKKGKLMFKNLKRNKISKIQTAAVSCLKI